MKSPFESLMKVLRFVAITIAMGITVFVFFLLLFRTEDVMNLLLSKPVIGAFFLTVGSILGFIVGAIISANRFTKELAKKNTENEDLRYQLNEAERIVHDTLQTHSKGKSKSRIYEILAQTKDFNACPEKNGSPTVSESNPADVIPPQEKSSEES